MAEHYLTTRPDGYLACAGCGGKTQRLFARAEDKERRVVMALCRGCEPLDPGSWRELPSLGCGTATEDEVLASKVFGS